MMGEKLPAPRLIGKAAHKTVKEVLEILKNNPNKGMIADFGPGNNECKDMVAVYGMAGVGKTAIMMNVYNQLLETQPSLFDKVIWVSGPRDLLYRDEYHRKLQENVAHAINVHLPNGKDSTKRDKLLYKALNRLGNYLLFLDDISMPLYWPRYNRIVVTTRSYEVVDYLAYLYKLKVELLSEKEARELLVNKTGIELTPRMNDIVEEVVKECAFLPLTIVTVAEDLKGKEEIFWREALRNLRSTTNRIMATQGTLYKSLKYQWDIAYDEFLKNRILFCLLYPKDWIILAKELTDYWFMLGMLDEYERLDVQARYRIFHNHPFLSEYLEVDFDDCLEWGAGIKMHPLHREFVLLTADQRIMSKCGLQLKELPDAPAWERWLTHASFMCNNIQSIAVSPRCFSLTTLFLNKNPNLCSIANAFFFCMPSLQILDLRDNGRLESLPDSVSNLEHLRALRLSRCLNLRNVPTVARLKQLEMLELDETAIEKLPQGIDLLSKLRVLKIHSLRLTEPLPSQLLSSLLSQPQLELQI